MSGAGEGESRGKVQTVTSGEITSKLSPDGQVHLSMTINLSFQPPVPLDPIEYEVAVARLRDMQVGRQAGQTMLTAFLGEGWEQMYVIKRLDQ